MLFVGRSRGILLLTLFTSDTVKKLAVCSKKLEGMGAARSDEQAQRIYLGKLATSFERAVGYSLNAYYTEDPIFTDRLDMRLITRIVELNEVFSDVLSQRGHTRQFDHDPETDAEHLSDSLLTKLGFEIPEPPPELADIIIMDRFRCPKPSNDSIMDHIEQEFKLSRGTELGTVSIPLRRSQTLRHMFLLRHFSSAGPYLGPSSKSNPNIGKILSSPM